MTQASRTPFQSQFCFRSALSLSVGLSMLAALSPKTVGAQPEPQDTAAARTTLPPADLSPVRVLVVRIAPTAAGAPALDSEQLRRAIAAELGATVVTEVVPDASGTLDIQWTNDGLAAVSFQGRGSDSPLQRTVALPPDPSASIEAIALLAGNLARNEAGELMESLLSARSARQAAQERMLAEQSRSQAKRVSPPFTASAQHAASASSTEIGGSASARGARNPSPGDHVPGATEIHQRFETELSLERNAWAPSPALRTGAFDIAFVAPLGVHGESQTTRYNVALGLVSGRVGGIDGFGGSFGPFRVKGPVRGMVGSLVLAEVHGNSVGFLGSVLVSSASGPLIGTEISGVANSHRGVVRGVQVAGVFNRGGSLEGGQLGTINWATGDLLGSQFGAVNWLGGDGFGVQAAGLVAVAQGHFSGVQLAGLVAREKRESRGLQLSGLVSDAGAGVTGLQFAGLVNLSHGGRSHVQIASLVNTGNDVDGVQLGLVNVAGRVRGTQLGLVNIAREMHGAPLGLVNVAKNGRVQVSLWHDRGLEANLALKLRSGAFYTQFGWGADSLNRVHNFNAGLGFHFGKRVYLETDTVFRSEWDLSAANLRDRSTAHIRAKVGCEMIPKRLSVFAGSGLRLAFASDLSAYQSSEPLWIFGIEVL